MSPADQANILLVLRYVIALVALLWAFVAFLTNKRTPAAPRASMWADLTKDHKTGHYVYKDLSKVVAFVLGCGLVLFAAYADYRAGRPVGEWGTVILLSYALGIGALKYKELQENRRTADENGNPLAVPGSAEPPSTPEVMPQKPQP